MLKETPIIFQTLKVRRILEWGSEKGWEMPMQTRRVIEPQPPHWRWNQYSWDERCIDVRTGEREDPYFVICPYGKLGNHLWVRENISVSVSASKSDIECGNFTYKADDYENLWTLETGFRTIPSIFMPKWMARIWLQIVDIQVERVQDIDNHQAWQEGIPEFGTWIENEGAARDEFSRVWDAINSKRADGRYSWSRNPWVWVITFKRINKEPSYEPD